MLGVILVAAYVVAQFFAFRASLARFPRSWSVAGEAFPDQAIDEVIGRIHSALDTPVTLHYDTDTHVLMPVAAGFRFDEGATVAEIRRALVESATAGNFLRHLIFQPPEPRDLPIVAGYSDEKIRSTLSDMALAFDKPAQPPTPNLKTMSLEAGQPGYMLNIAASVKPIGSALTSIRARDANLIVDQQPAPQPSLDQLRDLIQERLKAFHGNASVFIKDLRSGDEIRINSEVAYSAIGLMKIPIMVETYRKLNEPLDAQTSRWLTETIDSESGNAGANALLRQIGDGDASAGAGRLTASMRFLGLVNTFMATPYDQADAKPPAISTPANSQKGFRTNPDPYMQTTPEDIGLLLEMIYQCGQGGGALTVAYPVSFTPGECQHMIDLLKQNVITDKDGLPSLLRGGLPEGTPLARKYGWNFDTRADASIPFTPSGDFVMVVFVNTPQAWVEWEVVNGIMVDVARAAYKFFNPSSASAHLP